MLVGEQPGDHEDIEGTPFVGPAGRVLDEALEAAGIDRDRVYLTNAVKHFRFEVRGTSPSAQDAGALAGGGLRTVARSRTRGGRARCRGIDGRRRRARAARRCVQRHPASMATCLAIPTGAHRRDRASVVDPAGAREAPRRADGVLRRRSPRRSRAAVSLRRPRLRAISPFIASHCSIGTPSPTEPMIVGAPGLGRGRHALDVRHHLARVEVDERVVARARCARRRSRRSPHRRTPARFAMCTSGSGPQGTVSATISGVTSSDAASNSSGVESTCASVPGSSSFAPEPVRGRDRLRRDRARSST